MSVSRNSTHYTLAASRQHSAASKPHLKSVYRLLELSQMLCCKPTGRRQQSKPVALTRELSVCTYQHTSESDWDHSFSLTYLRVAVQLLSRLLILNLIRWCELL